MLELAVLGLLKERAMHGYELRKQLLARLGYFWTVSFGSLYPTLRRLERAGAVERVRSGEASGRRRQVYRITSAGERQFLDLLEEGVSSAWEEEKFPLRLAFFQYLSSPTRIRVLERRRAHLEEKLIEGRRSLTRARRSRADTWTLSLMRHGVEVTERDIQWLDELIAAERGQPGSPAVPLDPTGRPGPPAGTASTPPGPDAGTSTAPDDRPTELQTK